MFKLIYQSKEYSSASLYQPAKRVEMTLDSTELTTDELCQFFGDFIKGCGYFLDKNERVEIVKDESDEVTFADDYNNQTAGDDEFSRSLDADADQFCNEFANGMINEEFTDNENVDTTGYEPIAETPKEVQTEFNFNKETQ